MGYFVDDISVLKDPVKTHQWKLRLSVMDNNYTYDEFNNVFELMVKSTTVPEIETLRESVYFMGFEKKLPTIFKYQTETTVEILEPSDMIGYNYLTKWNQSILNSDLLFNSNTSILSATDYVHHNHVNIYTMVLVLFDNNGDEILNIIYENVWPCKIASTNIQYEGSNLYKYSVTFSHDKFRFVFPMTKKDSKYSSAGDTHLSQPRLDFAINTKETDNVDQF